MKAVDGMCRTGELFEASRFPRLLVRFVSGWLVVACAAMFWFGSALAVEDCGPVRAGMWGNYPVDYRKGNENAQELAINSAEERRINGGVKDVAQVLLYVPNDTRALVRMRTLMEKERSGRSSASVYSMNCWFDRAVRWAPDDGAVRKLYGEFLAKRGDYAKALEQFLKMREMGDLRPTMTYNIGLMYLGMKDYVNAMKFADEAYSQGVDLPALRDRLKQAGKWVEPVRHTPTEKPEPAETGQPSTAQEAASAQEVSADPLSEASLRLSLPPPPDGQNCGVLKLGAGPWDYMTDLNMRPVVEQRHFTFEVENLTRGINAPLPGDISYTLQRFPNHHRALIAMMRFMEREGTEHLVRSRFTMACWLERAARFRPGDGMVRAIYGTYFMKHKKYREAIEQYQVAERILGARPDVYYNMGLTYYHMKDWSKALTYAHKAYGMGFAVPGLREMLQKDGKWKDKEPGSPESVKPSAAPAVGAATPAAVSQPSNAGVGSIEK